MKFKFWFLQNDLNSVCFKYYRTLSLEGDRNTQPRYAKGGIGHSSLTHVHLVQGEQPLTNDQCNTQISTEHLLKKCTKYNSECHGLVIPALPKTIAETRGVPQIMHHEASRTVL